MEKSKSVKFYYTFNICWRHFGHILRRNEEIPANKAMQLYFHRTEKRFRGRPTATLPVTINKDLSQIQDNLSLKSTDDLKYLRSLAQGRDQWKSLTKQIVEIAEESRSETRTRKANKSVSHIYIYNKANLGDKTFEISDGINELKSQTFRIN